MLGAEDIARRDAQRQIAEAIRGNWIWAIGRTTTEGSELLVTANLEATGLSGVKFGRAAYDAPKGLVTIQASIDKANIIQSMENTGVKITPEVYQDLKYSLPNVVTVTGRGSWTDSGQKELLALVGAEMDARRKLVEQLRGVIIQSSTRMENFVVTQHEVIATIQNTLLIGVKRVREEIQGGAIAIVEIEMERTMFIYSVRKGLESMNPPQDLTPDEYQKLKGMLDQPVYRFEGKAAVAGQ